MQKCTENAWASLKVIQEHHGILGRCDHKANRKGILGPSSELSGRRFHSDVIAT